MTTMTVEKLKVYFWRSHHNPYTLGRCHRNTRRHLWCSLSRYQHAWNGARGNLRIPWWGWIQIAKRSIFLFTCLFFCLLLPFSVWPFLGVLHPHHMEELMQEAAPETSNTFSASFGFGDLLVPDLFHTTRAVSKSIVRLQHHLEKPSKSRDVSASMVRLPLEGLHFHQLLQHWI